MLLVLDLVGTFAFALNGALTAVRAAHIDIVGVVTLGMTTAVGGGIIRDILLGDLPPATFMDWRYLAVAAAGGLIAFCFSRTLSRLTKPIDLLDAAGLSLFAITGAVKALELGVGPVQAIILGTVTGVGGGTLRDVLIRKVPSVLSSGLYAIPALVGAALAVLGRSTSPRRRWHWVRPWCASRSGWSVCALVWTLRDRPGPGVPVAREMGKPVALVQTRGCGVDPARADVHPSTAAVN